MPDEIRSALIEVAPLPGNEDVLDGCPGGNTNFYALATSDGDFRAIATLAMESLGLRVSEIEDVKQVDPAAESDRVQALASELSEEAPWIHDTFHLFEDDD